MLRFCETCGSSADFEMPGARALLLLLVSMSFVAQRACGQAVEPTPTQSFIDLNTVAIGTALASKPRSTRSVSASAAEIQMKSSNANWLADCFQAKASTGTKRE